MQRNIAVFVFSTVALLPVQSRADAVLPDAGQLLRDTRPPVARPAPAAPPTEVEERPTAPAADGQRIAVQGLRITGSKAFSEAELLPLVSNAVGRELTLADLDALAARITRHYREAGYLVAQAYLPPQEIQDGAVTIAVQEGSIGQVEINNTAGLAPSALAPLETLAAGDPVRRQTLEGSLLALADLPGVEVKSTLRPGATVGASDFLVEVAPGPAFNGSVDFDNFGNRYTGAYRLGASLYWNNPAGRGDQVSLRAQTSDGGFAYGRLGYQLPLGRHATRIGAAWSYMRYELGDDFERLDADGNASVGSLYLQQPLLRSRQANWYGQIQYDRKRMEDRVNAVATRTEKTLDNWTLGVNGNFSDVLGGGGVNAVALGYTRGQLDLDAVIEAIDRATARSAGDFAKWTASFQRTQQLPADFALYVSGSGQWAGDNLDSSEKFTLGGAYGVRAYPQGEASGDEGWLATVELRRRLAERWELQGFYDAGRVDINAQPWAAGDNSRHLAGYGLGASYSGERFNVRAFAAWKAGTGEPTSDTDRTPRVWVQGAVYF